LDPPIRCSSLGWFALAFYLGCLILLTPLAAAAATQKSVVTSSKLLELTGTVEISSQSSGKWAVARPGQTLKPGDRLRTQALSRATVQLSDRSILRIRERTLVVIENPKAEKTGLFNLLRGALFFLNREKPNQIEFKTPLASGAIRGTEFLISVDEATGTMDLAVYQGEVALNVSQSEWSVTSGEQIRVAPNQTPQKTALIQTINLIQWALYYPTFLAPNELELAIDEQPQFATSLNHYRNGNLNAALASLPQRNASEPPNAYELTLQLSVGHVTEVESALNEASLPPSLEQAFRFLIAAVRFQQLPSIPEPSTASEWLALSYYHQSQSDLELAREAARRSTALAPRFGATWIRLAELEFSFDARKEAQRVLSKGLLLSPEQAQGQSLLGFIALESNHNQSALESFEHAIELDGDLGSAWLGKGIALLKQRHTEKGRAALQTAAALEPQRSLFRSYLAKAFGELDDNVLAIKEFGIAKTLDPSDPTPDFYAALHAFQGNRINESIRMLEQSVALNDNRSVHRSRSLLDRDLAMRSADLSILYAESGMKDVSDYLATRSILKDPTNFSGHLFLANSLQNRERKLGIDRRFESARSSELLTANLLAPLGSGNLSQILSQQDHLQYFIPRPFALNTTLNYQSNQSWEHQTSAFGTVDRLSYAIDGSYLDQSGQRPNQNRDLRQGSIQLKYHWSPTDSLYIQVGTRREDGEDLKSYYDPNDASPSLRFESDQPANLLLGYHKEWSPNSHTMILAARLQEDLMVSDTDPTILFTPQSGGTPTRVETSPAYDLSLDSEFTLYSAEVQHLFSFHPHSLILGSRLQLGDVDQMATLRRDLTGIVDSHRSTPDMQRANAYAYYSWDITDRIKLIGGLAYDHLESPINTDLAPISQRTDSRDLIAPKIGITFEPWDRGEFRAAYTQTLGGLFFDNSVRLEPSLVAGFNQSYRSLIPEGVAGLTPGSRFETLHASFNQSFKSGTYFGITGEILESNGDRGIGALTNGTALPLPDTATTLIQDLSFREESVSAYAHHLIGNEWAPGIRYRFSHATLSDQFAGLASSLPGVSQLSQRNEATLQELNLFLWYNHSSGFFGRWESNWYHQDNASFTGLRDDRFWQHNLYLGYRFSGRRAQLQFGLLNLFDQDYRLNPINLHSELPRARTVSVSARFNF
jgi:Tfp pilus assembly protein PilF